LLLSLSLSQIEWKMQIVESKSGVLKSLSCYMLSCSLHCMRYRRIDAQILFPHFGNVYRQHCQNCREFFQSVYSLEKWSIFVAGVSQSSCLVILVGVSLGCFPVDLCRATLAILEKITLQFYMENSILVYYACSWSMDVEFWTAFKIAGSQKILKSGT
jgi:hypothetical protein